ncbi:MAG: hypothetical protein NZ524_11090 [Thiobacillaceae bacterium]|nr:hypothetical protein [Thiobacillaceae bacterium]MCX7672783.1 hypothetical protein [Thiobacillaceae bacterium]MDW8324646.1 hypothetical protein [Burkholderiales bacterium]
MPGWITRLFHRDSATEDGELAVALERAAEQVEPRLKGSPDFPRRYRAMISRALEYSRGLAQDIPGPIEIDAQRLAHDALLRTLFSSPEQMRQALCLSHAMHEYARRPGGPGREVYALMGARRQEKTVFGVGLQGEVLQRGVAQRVLSFTDHTLSSPAPTEEEARWLLMWELYDGLLARVAERVRSRQQARLELEKERDLLSAELRQADPTRRPQLQQRLQAVLERLAAATAALDLRRLQEDFAAVLTAPEEHVRLDRVTLRIDGMGVLSQVEGIGVHTLELTELSGRDRRHWTVMLVHCHPRPGELSLQSRLQQASRWLQL